ncbi:MAG TPA: cytochrome c nitrite reductase small subunit [Bacteroidales bacterium]|nr:cytochrome c nitrite reductase small subunit [Bacteroidales bacterium]HPE54992.1 cytochrome c nitrite reductase small subunit [Bacteroidales bacterium]HRX98481.1 cytochrome c nitrite reductase small subunit [Bacteroidales bacterium]
MHKRIEKFLPPPAWQVPVIILIGVIIGLGLYIFKISNAASYLSDDPETCINCHVMNPQYATWNHSSHREVANCNDCHVPHNNVVNKYFFKAKDGLRHATIFTLRAEPQVIFIKDEGKEVVQQNCIRCHEKLVTDNAGIARFETSRHFRMERSCVECHRETPHGRVNSLASVPHAQIPELQSVVPEWLKKMMNKKKNNQ